MMGHDDAGLLADVFKDLEVAELSDFLPYSTGEIDAIFTASEVDLDDIDLDDDDDIDLTPDNTTAPPTHTIMRFKVPVLDAEHISERIRKIMAEQDFTGADSLTNAGDALVYLFGEDSDS